MNIEYINYDKTIDSFEVKINNNINLIRIIKMDIQEIKSNIIHIGFNITCDDTKLKMEFINTLQNTNQKDIDDKKMYYILMYLTYYIDKIIGLIHSHVVTNINFGSRITNGLIREVCKYMGERKFIEFKDIDEYESSGNIIIFNILQKNNSNIESCIEKLKHTNQKQKITIYSIT